MKKATRRWLLQSVRKLITCWQLQKLVQRLQTLEQRLQQQQKQQQERLQQQELLFCRKRRERQQPREIPTGLTCSFDFSLKGDENNFRKLLWLAPQPS
jgi:response regulator of citrate/malate metabolism